MKIYKLNDAQVIDNKFEFIDLLIDNDLEFKEKILNLSNAYERLILTPLALHKLIEKLFDKLDMSINFSRIGDNNARYDAILTVPNETFDGIIEIEVPSTAMLDAPRNLLDDIAVVSNRNGLPLERIVPIVICWTLPNNRTDYWNVINDVKNILDIKIKTLPIMAIAVHYWINTDLKLDDDSFYLDNEKRSLETLLHLVASKEQIDLSLFEGFFYPFK